MGDLAPIYLKVMFTYLVLPVLFICVAAAPFILIPQYKAKKAAKLNGRAASTADTSGGVL